MSYGTGYGSPRTLEDYRRYHERLREMYPPGACPTATCPSYPGTRNKWQRNLLRRIAEYQWARGQDRTRRQAPARGTGEAAAYYNVPLLVHYKQRWLPPVFTPP